MNSQMNEEKLLAQFRKLDLEGQRELLDLAALLLKKQGVAANTEGEGSHGQCPLRQADDRPEASAEPIFTE